jgi:osmotically-inducible protein OsmY
MIESLFVPIPPQPPINSATSLVAAVAMRRGQPQGPTNDQEVEELVYDTLELLSGAGDVDVRCESGRVTLSGTVSHKRLKHDIGEIAWAIPSLSDVANNITIASRRRTRPFQREAEVAAAPGRKQA